MNRPKWARIEVQVRPAKEAKETFASLSPMDVWGASRWTRDIAAKVLEQHRPTPSRDHLQAHRPRNSPAVDVQAVRPAPHQLGSRPGRLGLCGPHASGNHRGAGKGPLERQQGAPPCGNGGRSFGKRSLFPDRSRRRLFLGLGLFPVPSPFSCALSWATSSLCAFSLIRSSSALSSATSASSALFC